MHIVHHANALDFAAAAPEQYYDALLCDPPYGLGFMGKVWDKTGIAFRPETWAAFKRVMLPGAFGFAFASTRHYHRMATAIEAAGFILHPMIMWVFGCLSDDTEILTETGWKHYWELTVGERAASYSIDTQELEYLPIESIYEYPYADTAYRIVSDTTDQIVSKQHRCIVERGGKQVFVRAEALERQEVVPVLEDVSELQHAIYRRKFVPFAGVGSEVIGAMKAGWEVVDGAELDPTYCNIAAQRITYWAGHKLPHKAKGGNVKEIVATDPENPTQLKLSED